MSALIGAHDRSRAGVGHLDGRRALEHAAFGLLPALVTLFVIQAAFAVHSAANDFSHEYWVAARRLLDGGHPYVWTTAQITSGVSFPYPALTALAFAPFALLPSLPASLLFTAICIATPLVTLRVLGVTDRRLYGLALLWSPVVAAWQTGNLTALVGLLIALAWVHRDHPRRVGFLVALALSLKPFTWPLVLWLLATRRVRATGHFLWSAALLNLVAWLVVGPRAIDLYLTLSARVTHALFREGYGVPAFAAHLGLAQPAGTVLTVALGIACVVLCARCAWRREDGAALIAAVLLMLVASPLVWNHYFALLLVPLAIVRPRLGLVWFLPVALWVCPSDHVAFWQLLFAWAVCAAVLAACVRDLRAPPSLTSRSSLGPASRRGLSS